MFAGFVDLMVRNRRFWTIMSGIYRQGAQMCVYSVQLGLSYILQLVQNPEQAITCITNIHPTETAIITLTYNTFKLSSLVLRPTHLLGGYNYRFCFKKMGGRAK